MAELELTRGKIQDTMKAVRFHEFGGPEVLSYETVPVPQIRPGEALVRVKAASINHVDLLVEEGRLFSIQLPHIPGADVAGVVERISGAGSDEGIIGKGVVAYPVLACFHCRNCVSGNHNVCLSYRYLGRDVNGSYAEYVAVPAKNLVQMPPNMSFQEAASIPVAFLTAFHMIMRKAKVQRDETVLVLGAGGGIGVASIQMAMIAGANVIAAASAEEKLKKCYALGADYTIDYSKKDLVEEVMDITGGRGVDVVIDPIGSATFSKSLASLAKNGRLVVCGITSGSQAAFNIRDVYVHQREILGTITGTMPDFLEVIRLAAERKLRPVIDSIYPLSGAAEAQKRLLSRKSFGKIVLSA
ncbi:zinc-binding dehydrogenase [Candidatus Woesearchaeota archaeon]|nr:zinc-binding dehydrogenase [Candidatus Woesearchaeota archaeon]